MYIYFLRLRIQRTWSKFSSPRVGAADYSSSEPVGLWVRGGQRKGERKEEKEPKEREEKSEEAFSQQHIRLPVPPHTLPEQ